jgi:hypothetical protein
MQLIKASRTTAVPTAKLLLLTHVQPHVFLSTNPVSNCFDLILRFRTNRSTAEQNSFKVFCLRIYIGSNKVFVKDIFSGLLCC